MEVLQVRSVPEIAQIPPLCSPASSTELSVSLPHHVRARLSRIPPVPTTIKVPENTTTEPLTHTSSPKTSTTGNASHSSNADTVATSILFVPSFFFTSKIHVAPTMHIEEDLLSIWDQRVRITLKEILLREITTGSCIQELMMAGKDPFHLKPTVVVTCGNSKTQKLVKKVFRRQSWLKALLKTKGMGFVAVVQPVHLSSSSVTTLVTTTTATVTVYGTQTPTPTPSTASNSNTTKNNRTLVIAVSVTLSTVVFVICISAFYFCRFRRRRMKRVPHTRSWLRPQPEMSEPANLNRKYEPHELNSEPNPNYIYEMPTGMPTYLPTLTWVNTRTDMQPEMRAEMSTEQRPITRPDPRPFPARPPHYRPADGSKHALEYFTYIDPESNAPCGQKLYITPERESLGRHCTFGGLILVAGKLYALTAGHPFLLKFPISDSIDIGSPSIATPENEEVHTDDDSSQQTEPFWFDPDNNVGSDNDSETGDENGSDNDITSSERTEVDRFIAQVPPIKDRTLPGRTYLRVAYSSDQSLSATNPVVDTEDQHSDWALLSMLRPRRPVLSNTVTLGHDRSDQMKVTTVVEFAERIIQGDVHVLCGTDPRAGHLCASTSTIQVDDRAYDVRLIILNEKISPGCSGSWVISGQKLCGHIISSREDVPWAYMLPIQPIVQDIKRVCGTDDVRLPSAADMRDIAGDEVLDEEIGPTIINPSSVELWDIPHAMSRRNTM